MLAFALHDVRKRASVVYSVDERFQSRPSCSPSNLCKSGLMGLDEAGTARILREHRVIADAVVAKHKTA
jgi:hypothetical protein